MKLIIILREAETEKDFALRSMVVSFPPGIVYAINKDGQIEDVRNLYIPDKVLRDKGVELFTASIR